MEATLTTRCEYCNKVTNHYLSKRKIKEKYLGGKEIVIAESIYHCTNCTYGEKTIEEIEKT